MAKLSRKVVAEDPKLIEEIEYWLWRDDGRHRHWTKHIKQELSGTNVPYRPEFALALVEHMFQGHSEKSFGARMGVQPSTLLIWLKHFPEFANAFEIGKGGRLLKWEIRMNDSADGLSKAPPATLIYATNNHFPELYKNSEKSGSGEKVTTIIINTGISKNAEIAIEKKATVQLEKFQTPSLPHFQPSSISQIENNEDDL